ncbi:CpaE family protein [Egicoccus sp. AB-alg2]|uniref:AAA family ATPase n=1 Tax=Egicoccus sp. AB-alg2 TaxID=3242693 RepID=UPI00359E9D02
MIRALLATPDAALTANARAILEEVGDIEVAAVASHASAVTSVLGDDDRDLDVVVLHEDLGPLPVLDLARDLNHRFPEVGVVLLARDPALDLLRSAMSAGVRSVVRLPLTLAELQLAIVEANEWAQTVQGRLAAVTTQDKGARLRGRVIAVAGSKGGVGTTMVATQLALHFQRQDDQQRVALLDLDLQTGDVRAHLDLTHRRSVTDLVEVASELTTGHLDDAMFAHDSGLRVLLPPVDGEDAEDLDAATSARILGGIRSRYDVVVIDVGAVLTDASATALELADEVVVVCTPDVVSLRGVNRLTALWERLQVRDGGVRALLNRADRAREIQPSLAARVVGVPMLETVLPDDVPGIEHATNTGVPDRVAGRLRDAVAALAEELAAARTGPAEEAEPSSEQELTRRVAAAEAGSISAEFAGLILPVGIVLLVVWQAILAGFTTVLANGAAAEAARARTVDASANVQQVAEDYLFGYWGRHVTAASTADEIRVRIPVPMLVPGPSSPWRVQSSAGVVREPTVSRLGAPVDGPGGAPA